jgi:hypothetical protein
MNLKTVLMALAVAVAVPAFADVVALDTIYYDNEWKAANGPHFASYFRVVESNPKADARRQLRDYYITGELQGECDYVTIDRQDDANTVLNGGCTTYFKSGSIESKVVYENGARQGEYIRYYANNTLAERANYNNGRLDGLRSVFDEDGLCKQTEYSNGKPISDYYIMSSSDGLYSRVSMADDSPIYTSPNISEVKTEYHDGALWTYYIHDGLMVALTNTQSNEYGKYYREYVTITNNSFYPIEFDPVECSATLRDKKGELVDLEIQSAEAYDKRIKRTQNWNSALLGVAVGLSAFNAGYSTTTTTTHFGGSRHSYGHGHSHYHGTTTSVTHSYDPVAALMTQWAAGRELATFNESNFRERQAREEGYLKRTTIGPGESVQGYFNIKRKDGVELIVKVPIAGAEFVFPLDVRKK